MPARLLKLKLQTFTNGSYTGAPEPRLDARFKGSRRTSRSLPPHMKKVNQPIWSISRFHLEYFLLLIKNSKDIHARLDVLCRFVLVLRGIANDSYDKVAAQLGVSRSAVEAAYCVAFEALELASDGVLCSADVPAHHINNERTLADSIA